MTFEPKPCTTEWRDDPETFTFLKYAFDVAEAKRVLREKGADAMVVPLPVEDAAHFAGLIGVDPVDDWSKVDLSVPVILVTTEHSHLPIDGWHRIIKAKNEGLEFIPCVILNRAETKRVEIGARPKRPAKRSRK